MELTQKRLFLTKRSLKLLPGGRLGVKYQDLGRREETVVDLFDLEPSVNRVLYRPFKFLVVAILFASPALFIFLPAAIRDASWEPMVLSILFLIPSTISVVMFFQNTTYLVVLKNRATGAGVLPIWANKPDEETVQSFVDELVTQIELCHAHGGQEPGSRTRLFLAVLEQLAKDKILSHGECKDLCDRVHKQYAVASKPNLVSIDSKR